MIPKAMLGPDVLLCMGEEESEVAASLDAAGYAAPGPYHRHRGFSACRRGDLLVVTGALGSALSETVLWDLLRPGVVKRILLIGTAGAMGGFSGELDKPYLIDPVTTVYQSFDAPPEMSWSPTWQIPMPRAAGVSTDRFYGFSNLCETEYPAEQGLLEAWGRHGKKDAVLDMEVAPFYHYCEKFGAPLYGAIKSPANLVSDLDSLPEASAAALLAAAKASVNIWD